jgi:hypothetical protein
VSTRPIQCPHFPIPRGERGPGLAWVGLLEAGAGHAENEANSNPMAQLEQSTSSSRDISP